MTGMACRAQKRPEAAPRVRRAAVAGSFYTGDAAALRSEVERFLSRKPQLAQSPRMLVSPHAGYVFSGALAGQAYAAVTHPVSTVLLLGPSHRARFDGVSIADVDAYATPLGNSLLQADIVAKLRENPLVGSIEQAHREEHCLEVQIPFIQVAFPGARIVPIIMGRVSVRAVADLVAPHVDEATLVVASSDLSHFHSSQDAKRIDARSLKTILDGELDGFIDGCGAAPIRVLMHLARFWNLQPVLLDARNSHETAPQYGGPERVVGYAAVAYVAVASRPDSEAPSPRDEAANTGKLSPEVQQYLLKLARSSLEACVRGAGPPSTADAPAYARLPKGCFVTLHKHGALRGCIGNIEAGRALCDAVVENARSAALNDPRFPPVQPDELEHIDIEVSVLSVPELLAYSSPQDLLARLEAGRDGVILEKAPHRSTFLPQVWEQLPDKVAFLQQLSRKAGMHPDGWKDATIKTYRVEHFGK